MMAKRLKRTIEAADAAVVQGGTVSDIPSLPDAILHQIVSFSYLDYGTIVAFRSTNHRFKIAVEKHMEKCIFDKLEINRIHYAGARGCHCIGLMSRADGRQQSVEIEGLYNFSSRDELIEIALERHGWKFTSAMAGPDERIVFDMDRARQLLKEQGSFDTQRFFVAENTLDEDNDDAGADADAGVHYVYDIHDHFELGETGRSIEIEFHDSVSSQTVMDVGQECYRACECVHDIFFALCLRYLIRIKTSELTSICHSIIKERFRDARGTSGDTFAVLQFTTCGNRHCQLQYYKDDYGVVG
jgi:hypothetical protein